MTTFRTLTSVAESNRLDAYLTRRDGWLDSLAQKAPTTAIALRHLPTSGAGLALVVSVWLCVFGTTHAITPTPQTSHLAP